MNTFIIIVAVLWVAGLPLKRLITGWLHFFATASDKAKRVALHNMDNWQHKQGINPVVYVDNRKLDELYNRLDEALYANDHKAALDIAKQIEEIKAKYENEDMPE